MAQRILERSVLHAPAVSDTHCMPFNLLILPVVDIMFGDFSTLVMDQMVNQAAKVHYMSGGKWKVPMVMRATMGATRRSAAAALAVAARLVLPHARIEGCDAIDALRCQRADEDRDPGRPSLSSFSKTI